ncbi:MAG: hypothetical protein LRY50_06090 [Geovibrio sp.]|jgi:hypothetical protein|uniref:hypothetical protein n=1 Tax=Geovibrio ferrireducens TaxID=46201 RepID=UPI002245A49F|nr:hypothetical protein [Geovibrio ferrireducens]MCD8567919.1 hypothetical protein [Geovibrio sp.]
MAKNLLKILGFIFVNTFLFRWFFENLGGWLYESAVNRNMLRLVVFSLAAALVIVFIIKFGFPAERGRW